MSVNTSDAHKFRFPLCEVLRMDHLMSDVVAARLTSLSNQTDKDQTRNTLKTGFARNRNDVAV